MEVEERNMKTFAQLYPIWNQLTPEEQKTLSNAARPRRVAAGETVHSGSDDCVGLFLVAQGQLRAFILTEEGKELTLYRLFAGDLCLFSASCILGGLQLDILVQAQEETFCYVVPADYRRFMHTSLAVANYTNELMAARFADVMWLLDQVVSKSFDSRLAAFLVEETRRSGNPVRLTHEQIARHLGSAREVVTRMLQYFRSEGLVSLSRGGITLTDEKRLRAVAQQSLRE